MRRCVTSVNNLAAQQAAAENRINAIAGVLAEHVNQNREQARKLYGELRADLQAGIADAVKLETRSGTETVRGSHQVSNSTWWKPWTWGDTRTEYITTTESYRYLATADAIEQIGQYAHANAAVLLREFNRIINPAQLRADLRRALLAELDTRSENFNPAEFRVTLEGSLSRLQLPELQLSIGDPARAISAQFSGEVRDDSQMEKLRLALLEALQIVSRQLDSAFKQGVDELCSRLDALRDSLADELAKDIRAELQQLNQAFADKERELARYAEVQAICAGLSGNNRVATISDSVIGGYEFVRLRYSNRTYELKMLVAAAIGRPL